MRKILFCFLLLFSIFVLNSQELNSSVSVNFNQIQGSNTQIFKTLEKSLKEFINQTKWTNRVVKKEERIECSFTIIINSRDQNSFKSTLQIQSSRPVYGSSYTSTVLNIKDNEFDFKYNEFDPLIYNENIFDSNLIYTIVYYVYIILGIDADTFRKNGGDDYLNTANKIVLMAQQSGLSAWQNVVGKQNRFLLIDNLLSTNLAVYRTILYNYHRLGLDNFYNNKEVAKQTIENSVISLETIFNKSIGNFLIRSFFDAKADEIVSVYSDKSDTKNKKRLLKVLKKISVNNNSKWKNIK